MSRGASVLDISKYFAFGAVLLSFISTFLADGVLRLSRRLSNGGGVDAPGLAATLLRTTTVNLFGIGLATFGLQASVGECVNRIRGVNQGCDCVNQAGDVNQGCEPGRGCEPGM